MARYENIDAATVEGKRTIARLLALKGLLQEKKRTTGGVPAKTLGSSLLLATWNVREFGHNSKYGSRLPESLHYIAEVISAFDIVALQEVNENLSDLQRVMRLLGPDWKYLLTDITLGRQGNGERMAFVYDARKIAFEGLASQLVLPAEVKQGGKLYYPSRQLARSPMMVGFRCNWFKFTICTAHIYYGTSKALDPTRVAEIRILSKLLAERATSEHAWAPNMILLGDFNIFQPEDETLKWIEKAGFFIPPLLKTFEAGESRMHYDQIAFLSARYGAQTRRDATKAKAGVVTFFDKVFKDEDEAVYAKHMGAKYRAIASPAKRSVHYRQWRTFQMSDHRPLWIELPVDFSRQFLGKKMPAAKKKRAPAR